MFLEYHIRLQDLTISLWYCKLGDFMTLIFMDARGFLFLAIVD